VIPIASVSQKHHSSSFKVFGLGSMGSTEFDPCKTKLVVVKPCGPASVLTEPDNTHPNLLFMATGPAVSLTISPEIASQ